MRARGSSAPTNTDQLLVLNYGNLITLHHNLNLAAMLRLLYSLTCLIFFTRLVLSLPIIKEMKQFLNEINNKIKIIMELKISKAKPKNIFLLAKLA